MPAPCVYIITVNRVQNVFNVPIYENTEYTLEKLNNLLKNSFVPNFNLSRYQNDFHLSCHIGKLYFLDESSNSKDVISKSSHQVSVLLPLYNAEKSIKQCIDSLLGQTFQNFEIVCVDDGSTDTTVTILSDLISASSRPDISFKLVHPGKVGLAKALDIGIKF